MGESNILPETGEPGAVWWKPDGTVWVWEDAYWQRVPVGAALALAACREEVREFAEDVARQFGHHGTKDGRAVISTGGLSTLEWAFAILEWDDPHPVE